MDPDSASRKVPLLTITRCRDAKSDAVDLFLFVHGEYCPVYIIITMSDHEMKGHYELTEEEQADLEAELEEGYADIETQYVLPAPCHFSVRSWLQSRLQRAGMPSTRKRASRTSLL